MLQPIVAGPQVSSLGVGLVGWWKLDEGNTGTTAYDSSGNGNNGTWYGTQTGTVGYYSAGKVGPWAGTFDGSTDYIDVPDRASLNMTSNLTLSAWIKTSSFTGYPGVISQAHYSPTASYAMAGSSGHVAISFWPTSNARVDDGNWHLAAATFSSTADIIYIDGKFDSSFSPSTLSSTTQDVWLGRHSIYFTGLMDDLRIYNRVLAATEIQELYRSQR